jgi:hypothetical protein
MEKPTPEQKISPHGANHFSKGRSESESYSKYKNINERHRSESRDKNSKRENESESYSKYKTINERHRSESRDKNSKSESKGIKMENENKIVTFSTEVKANVTAKADEVKAIRKRQTEFRMEIGKQLDKRIKPDLPVTLPLHFATTFNISTLNCIHVTFTIFNISISIFQTFTFGNLRACEMLCSSQETASSQAETAVTAPATLDSTRSFRVPETRPNILDRSLHGNTLVPKQLHSLGRSRNPENDLYNNSFILIYLDLSR